MRAIIIILPAACLADHQSSITDVLATMPGMKREAGDGPQGGGPQKRYRGGDGNEIRLLIPSKVAGSIIGKGGHNISKLRSEHNASVTVPDCPGPERILTVAADLETMLNVVREILPNLEDLSTRGGRQQQKDEDEVDVRVLVHQSQAGCIIGKGGLKIKELRDKTGTRIKIYGNCCPQSTDRIVQINGKGELCIDAIRECMELLKSSPVKGMANPYDPHNYDDYFAGEYGGYGSGDDNRRGGGGGGGGGGDRGGPGGRSMRGGPSRNSDDGYGPPPRGGYGGPRGGGGGGGGGYGNRGGGGGGGMGNGLGSGGPQGGNYGGPPSFGGGSFGGPPPLGGDKSSTQVTIPKDLAGAIIGKGGLRIRKIRMDSGAGITIDEPLPGSNDRIITITGNSNQIQMAQYLLQQSVRENTGNY